MFRGFPFQISGRGNGPPRPPMHIYVMTVIGNPLLFIIVVLILINLNNNQYFDQFKYFLNKSGK